MKKKRLYEVETRVYFDNPEEAYSALPFLKECLINKTEWETSMYGIQLHNSGKILRTSNNTVNGTKRYYIGYKEEDLGKFFNIRLELDEEITSGLKDSYILHLLNAKSQEITRDNAEKLFESLGYGKFMSFTGNNLTGKHGNLELKLLHCPILRYPLLLEIELSAENLEEAHIKEKELKDFLMKYNLLHRALKEEPTTLLYETL